MVLEFLETCPVAIRTLLDPNRSNRESLLQLVWIRGASDLVISPLRPPKTMIRPAMVLAEGDAGMRQKGRVTAGPHVLLEKVGCRLLSLYHSQDPNNSPVPSWLPAGLEFCGDVRPKAAESGNNVPA